MKTFFLTFWNSVRGFRSYQLIFRNPIGVTLLYWFALCFFVGTLVVSISYVRYTRKTLPEFTNEVSKNIPEFAFQNGQLITSAAMPSISNTNLFPIVLDPEGKITRPPSEFTNGMFHIGRTEIKMWYRTDQKPLLMPIKSFPDGKVNHDYIYKFGKQLGYVAAPLLWVVLILVFFVIGLLQALFFTVLVSFLEKSTQARFSFQELFNISVYSLTPSVIVVVAYRFWDLEMPYDMLYFLTYILFHTMASGACRRIITPFKEDA